MNNHTLHQKPQKWVILWIICVIVFWPVAIYTGFRLPYLHTSFSFHLRAFFLFPLMFGCGIYFAFIYRDGQQQTGYIQSISLLTSLKEKIKSTAMGLLGLILITGGIAWTSVGFSAWAAKLFAKDPYGQSLQITYIKAHGGAVWSTYFDLGLLNPSSGETKVLRLNRALFDVYRWKEGEYLCLAGRTSMFGTAIDYQSKNLDDCVVVK